MKKSRATETQIISILNEADAGVKVKDICRKHGISDATHYNWESKYGGMSASKLKRMQEIERENKHLKKAVAELTLDKVILKKALEGNY